MALKPKIQALIDFANETTEAGDVTLGDAVKTLADGYNGGANVPSAPLVIPSGEMSAKLAALLAYSNEVTGAGDTRMGDAIKTLCEGYGKEEPIPLEITATSTWTRYGSYTAEKAVDGNRSTALWASGWGAEPHELRLAFNRPASIATINIYSDKQSDAIRSSDTIEVSDDGTAWEYVANCKGGANQTISINRKCAYLRIVAASNGWRKVNEITITEN